MIRPAARPSAIVIGLVLFTAGCVRGDPGSPSASTGSTVPSTAAPSSAVPSPSPSSPPATANPAGFGLSLERVASGLDGPLDIAVRPGDPDALFVAEQVGRVQVIRDGVVAPDPVLDIAGTVTAGGEQGLLGLTFHPDADDDRLFVYYTALDGQQVVSSFRMDPETPDRAVRDSEQVLLRMADQFGNHNGGGLTFGPDGFLYIATGDGGGGGDPLDSGRRLDTLLAKILRVDVDGAASEGAAYAIPADNPFVDVDGALPEIWHTGLRNPWRIRFDRATGDLWIGDVGQGAWEEIDRAPAGVGGLDLGWNLMEGTHCFRGGDCATADLTLPVTEYGHDEGCSVTGGMVYRGEAQPAMAGWYVFADYCSGRFWVIDAAAAASSEEPLEPIVVLVSRRGISAIAEDAFGELHATDLDTGEVLRIVATPS